MFYTRNFIRKGEALPDKKQVKMVIRDDEEYLRKKLYRRIEATVGLNK